jgi:hypothetical protein
MANPHFATNIAKKLVEQHYNCANPWWRRWFKSAPPNWRAIQIREYASNAKIDLDKYGDLHFNRSSASARTPYDYEEIVAQEMFKLMP